MVHSFLTSGLDGQGPICLQASGPDPAGRAELDSALWRRVGGSPDPDFARWEEGGMAWP